jgi:hypothetical protein
MLNNRETLAKLACCALCCVAAAESVEAAPPPGSSGGGLFERASGLLAANPSHTPPSRLDLQRLDLRAPATPPAERTPPAIGDSVNGFHSANASPAFPSAKRPPIASDSHVEDDLPALGGGAPMRTMSRAEEITRRVQREGLPVARLWESRSALLHVGLSPRGKPGLWLIQKVP